MQEAGRFVVTILACALTGCASHAVSIQEENDSLASAGSLFTNYSHGFQISGSPTKAHEPCMPDWPDCDRDPMESLVDFVNIFDGNSIGNDEYVQLRYGVAQQFFTPDDITIPSLQQDERPYAGWLYGFLNVSNEAFDALSGAHYRNKVGLRLGVIGPASLGEDMQKLWHKQCDCDEPQGWDHQLSNEPGFVYSIGQDRRLIRDEIDGAWSYDVIGSANASFGNVYTGADVGGMFRVGWHLDNGWGPKTMDDIGTHHSPYSDTYRSFYLFAGITGRLVGRDLFLDGNTWEASHRVKRRPLVYEQVVGFGMSWRQLETSVNYVYRSKQYTTQFAPTRFASITITWTPM